MFAKKSISCTFSVLFVVVFTLAVTSLQVAHAGVRYAKPAASGDCLSWANACTLQTALTGATNGDEIWVAAGTYKPTTVETDRTATFQLIDGVALYGGFAGTETARDQRNPSANVTILSGDIDNNDSQTPIITDITTVAHNTTNSYHVVTDAVGGTLDGFTVTAGNANGTSPNDKGGGLYNSLNGSTLTRVTFSGNSAITGGGMFNDGSSPTLMNVTFRSNSAASAGGGMFNNTSISTTFTNVTFTNNSSSDYAGGLFNWDSNGTMLTNVTFSGNTATNYGGGMVNRTSSPTLTNVTFSGNSASYGGGLWNVTDCHPTTRNTVFWGNTATYGAQIYNWGSDSSTTVSDSVVEDGCPAGNTCTNIITTDPLLGTLGDYGGSTQSIPLLASSSAINTGNDAVCPTTDQRGVTRPQSTHCDIGAFEYKSIYYVKPAASGDCLSWANACTLQTALTGATNGDEIWVAAGTYKPTLVETDRIATFQLIDGVALYGGFAGTETARDQRNPSANVTILSGEIGATGISDNSYHVVTGVTGATLDGFTITAGAANGTYPNNYGGGMYNDSSSPTLTNVTFSGNSAHSSTGGGGGMSNFFFSSPTLTNVTFSGNSASDGGGMINYSNSSPTLTNVTFSGNSGTQGGGMGNFSSSPTLTNVTFSGNSAAFYGGGMYNASSSPTLTNVTFSGNLATHGGGMFNETSGGPQIRNTIFWGNTNGQIYNNDGGISSVSDSVIQDGYAGGTNIIPDNPNLGALGDYGGLTQTIPLLAGSSAINTGNDAVCPATDQRGVSRPQGAHCDIGAYEYADTTAPIVTSITRLNPNPTKLASVDFTVTFSEAVNGVDTSDFALSVSGVSGATVSGSSGSGSVYTVTVNTGSGNGTIRLDVSAGATVTDLAGNPLTGLPYSSGENYVVDKTAPTVAMTSLAPDPTNASPIAVSVTFSESVTGFTSDDIAADNGAVSNFAGSGASYTFDLTPAGQGLVTANIAAGVATDSAGNGNTIAAQLSRTYDTTAPTVAMTSLAPDPTNASPIAVSVTFSESVTGFTSDDIAADNGAVSNFAGSGASYTFDLTPAGQGLVTANIAAGVATDSAGNGNTIAAQLSRTYDTTAPTVLSSLRVNPNPTNLASVDFTVTFSESVTGVAAGDFVLTRTGTISGESVTGVSGGPIIYTVTVNRGSGNGTLRLDVPTSATISDLAGNPLAGLPYTSGETYTVEENYWIYLPLIVR